VALTGLFWGFLIFGETPTSIQTIAVGLIIFSLFLLSWRQSRQIQGT
jgi:drug/metabolite transporter (DMT)-like permease